MGSSELKMACLAAGIASTWGSAHAIEVSGIVFNLRDQGPMHFMYATGGSGAYGGALMTRVSDGTSVFPADLTDKPFRTNIDFQPEVWGTIGWTGPGRVAVAVDRTIANDIANQPWEDVFPGTNEADIALAVLAHDYNTLGNFLRMFDSYFDTPFELNETATIVNYSVGTLTGQVWLVPEPASLAVFGLGLLALKRRRRA